MTERSRLNEIIQGAVRSNMLGASAFADSIRSEVADSVEAALAEATGGVDHLVRVRGGVWVIQHPLAERFEPEGDGRSLLDCRFTRLVAIAAEQGAFGRNGLHRVWLDRGVLLWEEVDG